MRLLPSLGVSIGCTGALLGALGLGWLREALDNKAVKRPLRPELFQMDVLGAN